MTDLNKLNTLASTFSIYCQIRDDSCPEELRKHVLQEAFGFDKITQETFFTEDLPITTALVGFCKNDPTWGKKIASNIKNALDEVLANKLLPIAEYIKGNDKEAIDKYPLIIFSTTGGIVKLLDQIDEILKDGVTLQDVNVDDLSATDFYRHVSINGEMTLEDWGQINTRLIAESLTHYDGAQVKSNTSNISDSAVAAIVGSDLTATTFPVVTDAPLPDAPVSLAD